ncbi:hypothetical protein [Oscillatoria sp. FACHB-1406]|uniref:hypothetical protein n=1 Tax=Oscillatoria sp. FACHB-1406 TaxID=2692846 RepID=UPI001689CB7D|nr:hypothetical protein [Oscillatoria sp. FACHB-1406]MBD2579084.1 hypothetical protein [Oscillatoria sp. FACHB-1406]
MNDNMTESNQTQIAIPPSLEFPAPLPQALTLPHWLLAIYLLSAISAHFYRTALVVLEIARLWKKPTPNKPKAE